MILPAELITPAEATAISMSGGVVESVYRAKAIYDTFLKAAAEREYTTDVAIMCALATVYDAGRIQGIRECRNSKK